MTLLQRVIRASFLPLFFLAGLLPRRPDVWVFGAQGNSFGDNSKYLFIHVLSDEPAITAVWISGSRAVIDAIRRRGGRAYARWSLMGLYYAAIAKYWFYSAYSSDINFYLSNGATLFNLWHGLPLKKIEFDIDSGPLAKLFRRPTLIQRCITHPHLFQKPSFVLAPSPKLQTIFASAFRLPLDQCPILGYPRTDVLADPERYSGWRDDNLAALERSCESFKRVWLYMPTWRDSTPNFLEGASLDIDQLNDVLRAKEEVLVVKLHMATPLNVTESFAGRSNIIVADPKLDLQPFLPRADALITDYSSVYFDYLLLKRPIFFFCYDLHDYQQKSRALYFNYKSVTPGPKIDSARELLNVIGQEHPSAAFATDREKVTKEFLSYERQSSARVCAFVRGLA